MEPQPVFPSPHHYIPMAEWNPLGPVRPLQTTEQEHRRQPQGNRNDWLAEVPFILVLVQAQPGARQVVVDQARIRDEPLEPRYFSSAPGEVEQHLGQGGPGLATFRIGAGVAVTLGITHPTQRPAIGQRYRHVLAPWRLHVPERRGAQHRAQGIEQWFHVGQGEAGQQQGMAGQALRLGAEQVEAGLDHGKGTSL